ncbi:MAG TPA: hypothetical protein VEP89_02885 [Draconibacterium sp.]|nr:hypothetical protein [Draconibacterium sp.]
MENRRIKEEIIQLIKNKNECELGAMVSELDYSYNRVLQNVLELKRMGKIFKSAGNNGYFSLKSNVY